MKPYPLELDLTKDTEGLKKLIAENPDLPIVVLADENSANSDWGWTFCSDIWYSISDLLKCVCPYEEERVCTDRGDFEEQFEEWLYDQVCDELGEKPNEEEFEKRLKEELAKYEPYWVKVIAIYATN